MTRRRLEKVLGDLEGGYAVVYPTGMNTVTTLLMHLRPKAVYISAIAGYFGVRDAIDNFRKLIRHYQPQLDAFQIIDLDNGQLEHQAAATKVATTTTTTSSSEGKGKSKIGKPIVWLETPKNPICSLQDIAYYRQLSTQIGAVLIVDATFAPVLQKPLALGADFVVYSGSKYLGGHSDVLAGVIVTSSEAEANLLCEDRSNVGNTLGSLETLLLLRSLRTLEMRIERQSQTATQVATWLEAQIPLGRRVKKVWYPGLRSSPYYELCQRQMGGRGGGMLSVELDTAENALEFQKHLTLFRDATSFGGYESLIDYRYRWDTTVSPTLLRVSIGLEAPRDLIQDFDRALHKINNKVKLNIGTAATSATSLSSSL